MANEPNAQGGRINLSVEAAAALLRDSLLVSGLFAHAPHPMVLEQAARDLATALANASAAQQG